ncbi:MAG: maleylpyruvate isomerase N-terminal domain-containing protein [Streptosporangiaceae bacterium]
MKRVSRAGVLSAYRDGVTVICELAAQFTRATWLAATPCAEWRAVDLAGHLRCVADDYHEYLDDAPASRLARLMSTGPPADSLARKLARQNAAELAALPDVSGPEHIAAFAESARSYGRRLPLSWDLPHHQYRDTEVTVGAMAGLACGEWHLHAWDLARSLGKDYRPADPELVLAAWRAGAPQLWPELAAAEGEDPWHFLLTASGRDPRWLQVLKWCASIRSVTDKVRRVVDGPAATVPVGTGRGHPRAVRRRLAGARADRVRLPWLRPGPGRAD